jgi:hypothetical protein
MMTTKILSERNIYLNTRTMCVTLFIHSHRGKMKNKPIKEAYQIYQIIF